MSTTVSAPPVTVPVVRTPVAGVRRTPVRPGGDAESMRRRGRLVLSERVVEKIAGQAATEVVVASGRSGGFLGIRADAGTRARPKVEVTLSAESADLAITVGIAYPGSIRAAAQEVRDHVTERVESLTGVDVRRVDIEVAFLTADGGPTRKALR